MLCLNRRVGEEIDLTLTQSLPAGTRLKVAVVGAKRGQSQIGISAPRSVIVDRAEITARKAKQQRDEAIVTVDERRR